MPYTVVLMSFQPSLPLTMVKLSIITSLEQRESMLRRDHLIADIASFQRTKLLAIC